MQAVTPADLAIGWSIDGTSRTNGAVDEVVITVAATPAAREFTVRTMLRTGDRTGP